MAIYWIHTRVIAPQHILEDLEKALNKCVDDRACVTIEIDEFPYRPLTDTWGGRRVHEGRPHLFTDTWDEDTVNKSLEEISKK